MSPWKLSLAILTLISKSCFCAEDSLVQVHALFRHGNRTPEKRNFPNDPYINETYFPYGLGQLTNTGKQTMYNLGLKLKERYDSFLNAEILFDLVEGTTSDLDRTKMSLDLVLFGLFPATGKDAWHETFQWQGFPFKYEKIKNDKYLNGFRVPDCNAKFKEFLNLPSTQEELSQLQPIFDYLEANTGLENFDLNDGFNLYFYLTTQEEFGLTLPDWTDTVYPNLVGNLVTLQYQYATGNDDLKSCNVGHFVKKVLDDSKAARNGTLEPAERKIFLYSGHEMTIAATLRFLDVFTPHIPKYGSCIIIELHVVDGIYGYKFYYEDYSSEEPNLLIVPGCDAFCPLDKFIDLFAKILPS